MSNELWESEARLLRKLLNMPPRDPPLGEESLSDHVHSLAARGQAITARGSGVDEQPMASPATIPLSWVREELATMGDLHTDRFRALANELYVRARSEAQFRHLPEGKLFVSIATAVMQIQEEIARAAVPSADSDTVTDLAGLASGTTTTVADAREQPAVVLAQLGRLAAQQTANPTGWEAFVLTHYAGRRDGAELERWLGDYYAALVRTEEEVIGAAA